MIEIKGERELIQIDVSQSNTNERHWKSGYFINCDVYFQKLECKFASKDIVISYNALKTFNYGLTQMINHDEESCFLNDENRMMSLRCAIDRSPLRPVIVKEGKIYSITFEFIYTKGRDLSLSGYLFSNKDLLNQTIQQIDQTI